MHDTKKNMTAISRGEFLSNKRNCYLLTMSTARRSRAELMNYLFAINLDRDVAAMSERLEEARMAFNASLAELQLTGAKRVVQSLEPIRERLSGCYASIKDFEETSPGPSNLFDELKQRLLALWVNEWPAMLEAMRIDLGVED